MKKALLKACHTDGEDTSNAEVLVRLAGEAGLDPQRARAILQSDEYAAETRARERLYTDAGIHSVPAIIINNQHLISGGQPVGGLRARPAADCRRGAGDHGLRLSAAPGRPKQVRTAVRCTEVIQCIAGVKPVNLEPAAWVDEKMRGSRFFAASVFVLAGAWLLASCSSSPALGPPLAVMAPDEASQLRWLDRVTWGANAGSAQQLARTGLAPWLRVQLHPPAATLPPEAQAQIDAMTISRTPVEQLAVELDAQRRAADWLPDEEQKKTARRDYQQALTRLAREAQQRFVLRALYSPNQLQEQMTWFWMNHFNVYAAQGQPARAGRRL